MSGSTAASPSPSDVAEQPSEALSRVRRGELTLDDYLETLVETGVAHLKGRMPEDRLEIVRNVLRDSLRESPEFQETVRLLTGHTTNAPSSSP
ncbi:MAG: hypothetical protein ACOY0T_37715 [Myxococcota bacterium]